MSDCFKPPHAAIVHCVLLSENCTTFCEQMKRHLADPTLSAAFRRRLESLLMDSAAVLFPSAPWSAQVRIYVYDIGSLCVYVFVFVCVCVYVRVCVCVCVALVNCVSVSVSEHLCALAFAC